MVKRRSFLAYTGGAALTLYAYNKFGIAEAIAAPLPGGTLNPTAIPKYVTPLLNPPAMPTNGAPNTYEIEVRQFSQQILPAPLPRTTVWGYGPIVNGVPGLFNAPSLTIEAKRGTPTTVIWRNRLVDASGNYLPHLLPVDPTLHWANPGMIGGMTDMRPNFNGKTYVPTTSAAQAAALDPATQYTRYWGPVPFIPHVHGMNGVEQWSDGYAEAWYLPSAANLGGYAPFGRWYDFMKSKAGALAAQWGPGQVAFQYPNSQRPGTVWYHDHALGITRLNVVAGPAGFWLIRSDNPADNPTVASGAAAVLPSGAYEVPIAIQDRAFNVDGSVFYPDTRAFFDAFAGPYVGSLIAGNGNGNGTYSDVAPIYNPEFFGNTIMVNGNTWPFLGVEPRRYRLRLLNGCTARTLILRFDDAKVDVWQIGNEGGYLRAAFPTRSILLAPAERADLIVDFSRVKFGTSVTLLNDGPDAPFGGGGFKAANPQTTGQVMQFRVNLPLAAPDTTTLPAAMIMPADIPAAPVFPPPAGAVTRTRPLALLELMATPPLPPIPVETNLGTISNTAAPLASVVARKWADAPTETPNPGDTEMWELYNFTVDAHPIHIHEVLFQVVNRQRIDKATGAPILTPTAPFPWENGFKDTVIAYPGEVTRVQMKFGAGGRYVWHCHIVDHEDNEMMRPYQVGTPDPNQPADGMV